MPTLKDEEIKVRVPGTMKAALTRIADARLKSISDVAREALLAYVESHGVSAHELRDAPAQIATVVPPRVATTYRKTKPHR